MRNCPDCGVEPGRKHMNGCDVERCSYCRGQRISCNCWYDGNEEKHSKSESAWSGEWPGVVECRELGWYCYRNPNGPGWLSCDKDHPGATEDLNRWTVHIMGAGN